MERSEIEILGMEKAFAQLVKEKGQKIGFLTYAADEAVLSRGNKLIKGKKEIEEFFDQRTVKDVCLEWEAEFVQVSASGDLGYTYGRFVYEGIDPKGNVIKSDGIFHTVWKREANGEWRYVWD